MPTRPGRGEGRRVRACPTTSGLSTGVNGDGTPRQTTAQHGTPRMIGGRCSLPPSRGRVLRGSGGARSTDEVLETGWREGALVLGAFRSLAPPQQAKVPSLFTPQVWKPPALTCSVRGFLGRRLGNGP